MYNDLLVKSYMDIPRNKIALAIKEVFVVSQKRARKVFTMFFFLFFFNIKYTYMLKLSIIHFLCPIIFFIKQDKILQKLKCILVYNNFFFILFLCAVNIDFTLIKD